MSSNRWLAASISVAVTLISGCGQPESARDSGARVNEAPPAEARTAVTGARIKAADNKPGEWLTHGRTYDEQRFSPLERITDQNVAELGLAWFVDLDFDRGVEATPLIADGVMYTTGSWSVVYAIDAATGGLLWKHDPQVPRAKLQHLCCDAVNRGVALWGDKVYVGTLDSYLVALDRITGKVAWKVSTIQPGETYAITGAPRIVKGKVLIGNGGSEFGVRGYVTAYDADTGEQAWRFYTVPGNPAEPFESPAMEMAAETWKGGEWWTVGGGGTVWDSMAYDPELDLVYIGVGNGAPWSRRARSTEGGDNLFLSSIVALRPDTGEYVWHYQTTPGDAWDYTATQHMILADIEIDGATRQVLMQAPKNGFFYVLDRATGELLSAENFVQINWATGIDMATGRPIMADDIWYEEPRFTIPGPAGAHNWQPMSYSPLTGLVYIPAQQLPHVYAYDDEYEFTPGFWNTGLEWAMSAAPEDPEELKASASVVNGKLLAWDPRTQQAAWTVDRPLPWGGGVLSTAGNLVFQGMPTGEFLAYSADTGEQLWSFDAQTGVFAGPVSYEIDGEQYVAVSAGWGSIIALIGGEAIASMDMVNRSRVLAFKLGGTTALPPPEDPPERPMPELPDIDTAPELVARGKLVYYDRCNMCHGDGAVSGGVNPDLRYSTKAVHERWDAIVLDGERHALGMAAYRDAISAEDSRAIHAYVVSRARATLSR
ncbi:MAG: PQQ-dependent dehydrogenase, methanol/ethanol family [Gammaproteobacteria bacterium]|nr:PQQ-dependent dehydrogenase, methanol/ethanol family [Gammaproteobacteria bacterium]